MIAARSTATSGIAGGTVLRERRPPSTWRWRGLAVRCMRKGSLIATERGLEERAGWTESKLGDNIGAPSSIVRKAGRRRLQRIAFRSDSAGSPAIFWRGGAVSNNRGALWWRRPSPATAGHIKFTGCGPQQKKNMLTAIPPERIHRAGVLITNDSMVIGRPLL